mmetsp:Transcript_76268/g.134612  ORF Transcript_76268/g.134612 Transcript_76268/m.134612 type:complete len:213 (-) Transcript_76268:275-913(-)
MYSGQRAGAGVPWHRPGLLGVAPVDRFPPLEGEAPLCGGRGVEVALGLVRPWARVALHSGVVPAGLQGEPLVGPHAGVVLHFVGAGAGQALVLDAGAQTASKGELQPCVRALPEGAGDSVLSWPRPGLERGCGWVPIQLPQQFGGPAWGELRVVGPWAGHVRPVLAVVAHFGGHPGGRVLERVRHGVVRTRARGGGVDFLLTNDPRAALEGE